MKIFIDPGHGGKDPGATGNGLQEKDVVLELALALAQVLEAYDCQVKLARDKDIYVDNGDRTKEANRWGADLYFSIHINGHTNIAANGYEDFIHLAAPQATANIRKTIHASLSRVWINFGRVNRGTKTANFQVLRETKMPAVLVENGFISNKEDADLLRNKDFRIKLVNAMLEGIVNALDLEKKQTGTTILGTPQATVDQAQEWARSRGAHQRFVNIAPVYWEYGEKTSIRPEVLYCQSAKETAFGKYTGVVKPDQNNWAGIKTRDASGDRPEDHESFPTPEDGVRAHFNHICAYVGLNPIGEPHGRYLLVKSLPWAGSVRHVEELGGRWAPAADYGESIVRDYLEGLLATEVSENDRISELEARIAQLEEKLAAIKTIIG
jgi:N-acetylmuramoyl-L-alanine amidase